MSAKNLYENVQKNL